MKPIVISKKKFKIIILASLSILTSLTFGYFFGYLHHLYSTREPIEIIDDINPKVCTLDFIEIDSSYIKGRVGEKEIRIIYNDEIIFPNSQGIFEILK